MEKSFLRRTSYEGAGKIKKVLYNNWLIAPWPSGIPVGYDTVTQTQGRSIITIIKLSSLGRMEINISLCLTC